MGRVDRRRVHPHPKSHEPYTTGPPTHPPNLSETSTDIMGKKKSGKKSSRPKLTPVKISPRNNDELNDDVGLGFDDIVSSSSSSARTPPCESLSMAIPGENDDDAAVEVARKEDEAQIGDIVVVSYVNGGRSDDVTGSSTSGESPSNDDDDPIMLGNLDSPCVSASDAKKETATEFSVKDADDEKEPSAEVAIVEVGPATAIEKDVPLDSGVVLHASETFSDSDDLKFSPSQLSQDLDEISIDSLDVRKPAAPLIRAYNGIHNGISRAASSTLSFSFKDCSESEAFVFLTASLREALGDDARDVTDETLSRYIRWKPDVERAADRFRANQAFRKENSYIFGDKPMLLSQDPKLAFLLLNGMAVAPEEVFAKNGSGIIMIRGSQCDVSAHHCSDQDASRAIFYTLQHMLERNTLDPLRGITIILDLEGALRKNIPKRLPHLLSQAAGCFPLRIQAIYVLSSRWWCPAVGSKKLGLSAKMQTRVHFFKNKSTLYEYIEKDMVLKVYSFDMQSWISSTFMHEVESS